VIVGNFASSDYHALQAKFQRSSRMG